MEEYTEILDKIKPKDGSGVLSFDKAEFEKLKKNKNKNAEAVTLVETSEVLEKCLSLFRQEFYSDLLDYLYEDPSRISSNEIKAIKFLTEVKLNFQPSTGALIKREHFYDYKKDLIFAEALIDIAKILKLDDIDFFAYSKNLPQLNYSFIKSKIFDHRLQISKDEFLEFIEKLDKSFLEVKFAFENDAEVIAHYEERVIYLKALIYKKIQDVDNARIFINLYLDKSFNLEEKISKLLLISNQELFSADALLSNMKISYGEVSEISSFISDTSLLTQDTCGAYSCDDCCRYTYPSMSLTEFEYIKNWALENNFDFSKAIENAKKIQDKYKKEKGKVFKIENKTDEINLNPEDFKFDCPFLEEGRCSIHPARPLLCRVFGSGATDANYLKSCNYYLNQYQYLSSPEHERLVYDARGFQAALDESDKYLTQSDTAKTGLIPAFLMDLEQNAD